MRWTATLVVMMACGEATPRPPPTPADLPSQVASAPSISAAQPPPTEASGPALIVVNPTDVDIHIYGAYLVDEAGARGTTRLWPHRADCPAVEVPSHLVAKNGGELRLSAPIRAYGLEGCELGPPLPSGAYLLRLGSGYGEELYAAATLRLPLVASVELRFDSHAAGATPCTQARATRAARLALSAARGFDWLPHGFFTGCNAEGARCGETYEASSLPPDHCIVTLTGGKLQSSLLRIERPAGDDAPRGLSTWVDPEVVHARRPEITRTSASRVDIGGRSVIISGTTSHHIHDHGGDAASIDRVELQVRNPHARALSYSVEGIELLANHSCALPQKILRRPALVGATPKTLPPGDSSLELRFAGQPAYQAHCDRFATRVRLLIEGKRVVVSSEHEVMRVEPMRE